MSDVLGQMGPLFSFSHAYPELLPYAALDQFVATHIINAQVQAPVMSAGIGGPPMAAPLPQNVAGRAASFSSFPVGASPIPSHLPLPGSPHTGSPAPMGAPVGPVSVPAPIDTSPASTKRRRPSETTGAGGSSSTGMTPVVTHKVKPSPRAAKKQRPS